MFRAHLTSSETKINRPSLFFSLFFCAPHRSHGHHLTPVNLSPPPHALDHFLPSLHSSLKLAVGRLHQNSSPCLMPPAGGGNRPQKRTCSLPWYHSFSCVPVHPSWNQHAIMHVFHHQFIMYYIYPLLYIFLTFLLFGVDLFC